MPSPLRRFSVKSKALLGNAKPDLLIHLLDVETKRSSTRPTGCYGTGSE